MLLRMLMRKCLRQSSVPLSRVPQILKYSKVVQTISSSSLCSFTLKATFSSPTPFLEFVQKRFLKKKIRFDKPVKNTDVENESDADESDVEEEDSKVMHKTVISLRLDAVGKTCFGLPRAKFEECFYNVSRFY